MKKFLAGIFELAGKNNLQVFFISKFFKAK